MNNISVKKTTNSVPEGVYAKGTIQNNEHLDEEIRVQKKFKIKVKEWAKKPPTGDIYSKPSTL